MSILILYPDCALPYQEKKQKIKASTDFLLSEFFMMFKFLTATKIIYFQNNFQNLSIKKRFSINTKPFSEQYY